VCPRPEMSATHPYYGPMASLHINAAMMLTKEWDSDPKTAEYMPYCTAGIRTGRWDRDYLDAVGQIQWGGPSKWPRHEVAAFAKMHYHLMMGTASKAGIKVSFTPFPDAERDANASVLKHLPAPFSAYVDKTQRNDDQDGWLEWDQPITADRSVGEPYYSSGRGHPEPVTMPLTIPPGKVPLEIGTTLPSRTLLHLGFDQGVARWPYDSTRIWLFISSNFPRAVYQSDL
jgi:hypothetical protein